MPDEIELPASDATGPQIIAGDVPTIVPAPAAEWFQRVPAVTTPFAKPQGVPLGAPATTDLAAQLLPAVKRGYVLAQRGAVYAARTEFVQVLRRVAQAKDMAANCDEHSQALAAGLRALDEAEDFVPAGVQLEAELDVRATASSHRTPVIAESTDKLLPHVAVKLYHDYAREQLAKAVAGEQAGSMALYGLGRIDAQLAERKDDDVRFVRDAMTMYAAALAACPNNHLAANELGVLECRTGRPAEAARLFERTIDVAPTATAYHNLAVAQQKLGQHGNAQANEQESQRLAALERAGGEFSRRAGVRWVAPEEMARVAQPGALTPPPTHAATTPLPARSPWQRTVELTRTLPRPGFRSTGPTETAPAPGTHTARRSTGPNQNRWR
jgi:tetratricopeptide (TPR) repeat protein